VATTETAAPEVVQKELTLEVLKEVKTSQNQHGLRNGDFQRYRQYSSRRARRIRKALKIQNKTKQYVKKDIDVSTVKDNRYLLLALVKAETAWAYAMEMKGSDDPRVLIHMKKRLAKAVKWSQQLLTFCEHTADKRTTLEAEAYCSWLKATNLQQREEWHDALSYFNKARIIYEQLGKIGGAEVQSVCKEKSEEISTSIRYCEHRARLDQGSKPISDNNIADIQSKLDSVVADELKKQAENTRDVVWKGSRIPIKNEKVLLALLNAQEVSFAMDKAEDYDAKASLYDNIFVSYNDALDHVRDDISAASGNKQSGRGNKGKVENSAEQLSALRSYIQHEKLSKTIDRNILLTEQQEKRLGSNEATEASKTKRSTPAELIKLYETLMQNLTEMSELQGEDEEAIKLLQARILSYKCYRCYYKALSYSSLAKWPEARALLNRAEEQVGQAKAHHQACKNPNEEMIRKLDGLEKKIKGSRCEAHARAIIEKSKTEGDNKKTSFLNFDPNVKPQLASFPPDFEPVGCKPVLFDIAAAGIDYPSLDSRVQKKGWLGGWFRG